jgi:surface antigen
MINSKALKVSVCLIGLAFLAGCQGSGPTLGQTASSIAGNTVGNTVASQIGGPTGQVASSVASSLASGVIGNLIGQNLDQNSQQAALQAEYKALENGTVGQPVQWQGSNGSFGQVIPQQPYQVGSQDCRRFTHTITVDGVPQQASGTACRNADGTWQPLT